MEEAEKVADRVAIIDDGRIIQIGTPEELKKSTKSKSLEEAFLKLTGHSIREESASAKDRMKLRHRAWGRR
jgi:ABC-2 type transport system ATP-binding protein